jgi:hypothetical protein
MAGTHGWEHFGGKFWRKEFGRMNYGWIKQAGAQQS